MSRRTRAGKGEFCLPHHLLLPAGTAPRRSVLSPVRLPGSLSAHGQLGAPLGHPDALPQRFCQPSKSLQARQAPEEKPPAGRAARGRRCFAESGELKVTLKMEGSRSVTHRSLTRAPLRQPDCPRAPSWAQGRGPQRKVAQPLLNSGKPSTA